MEPSPFPFLRLPSELQINSCQFLSESDLYSLQKTCRSVAIIAKDPYSLTEIDIDDTFNINNYTHNTRYSMIKALNLRICGRKSYHPLRIIPDLANVSIAPLAYPFDELKDLSVDLRCFSGSIIQFNELLTFIYSLLAKGRNDKILRFSYTGENLLGYAPKMPPVIFNNTFNGMAMAAIKNVKTLFIDDYRRQGGLLPNLLAMLPNADSHSFDEIYVILEGLQSGDICDMKFLNSFRRVVHKSKFSKLDLSISAFDGIRMHGMNSDFTDWIEALAEENKWFTSFEVTVFVSVDRNHINDETFIEDFKNETEVWGKLNESVMEQIGMKLLKVTYVLELDFGDQYCEDEIEVEIKLKSQLERCGAKDFSISDSRNICGFCMCHQKEINKI